MAKQYKKILRNIKPKEPAPAKKEKPKRDLFLTFMMCFTIFVLIVGWSHFDHLSRAMYAFLSAALGLTYMHRQGNLGEKAQRWLARASLGLIAIAVVLFAVILYRQITS